MRNSFIQDVLDEIDIVDLISYDVAVENNKARCPFPDHQDANPSFTIYPPDSFYCFGCKRGGTAIDYIMHRDNVTTGEAIRILCEKYNIFIQWSDEEKKAWEKQRQEGDIVFKILSEAAEYYHSRLTQNHREYFHNRGLNDETIDNLKLGYADGSLYSAFKNEIAEKHNNAELLLSGLFVKFEDGTIKDSFERRYMFPYWKSGKVVYFIGRLSTDDPTEIERLPKWNRAKYKKLSTFDKEKRPYISQAVRNDYFYSEDSVGENETGIITEGVIDCIHLLQAGYSCISPVTEEFKEDGFPKLAKLSKRWKTVYIANDNEESGIGEQGAIKTAKYLFERGLDVRLATVPRPEGVKKVDVADFFNVPSEQYEQRKQEFQAILDEAPNFLRFKIDKATELSYEDKLEATREIFLNLAIIKDRLELERYAELMQKAGLVKGKRLFWGVLKDTRIEQAKERKAALMESLEKESPEIFIKAQIEEIRKNKYEKAFRIKRQVSDLVIDDMREHGRFYRTPTDQYYWFSRDFKRLCEVGDKFFEQLVNDRYGLNKSEVEYEYLIADMETEAGRRGKKSDVYRFAYYDKENHVLYIDRNDFQMYRLNGKSIELLPNGADGVLFITDPQNEPFELKNIGESEYLRPLIIDPTNFVQGEHVNLNPDEQRYLFQIWLYTLFFEELQPTKPIQVFLGAQGSGKTTRQRSIGVWFFGQRFNVQGIGGEDDFIATITHNYFAVFDNVDAYKDWLNDRLAQAATGQRIEKRELYTTNRLVRYYPRCFLSLNSREPKFKRPDVVDRLLLFRVQRLEKFVSESRLIGEIQKYRNELWTEMLIDLNQIVAALKEDNEPFLSQHRMADWAELGWRIAKTQDAGDYFVQLLEKMNREQSQFVLEEDPIFLCLDIWVNKPGNQGRQVTASTLYYDFQIIAEQEKISFTFKSAKSFGRRLHSILSNLEEFFNVEAKKTDRWYYILRPKVD